MKERGRGVCVGREGKIRGIGDLRRNERGQKEGGGRGVSRVKRNE